MATIDVDATTTDLIFDYDNQKVDDGQIIPREQVAHLVDASFGAESTPLFYRLGEDLEEFNIDLNPDVETRKNIIAKKRVIHRGYDVSATVDTFYAYKGDPLFEYLNNVASKLLKGDKLKTTVYDVHFHDGTPVLGYKCFKDDCYIIPTQTGGDTSNYRIPFQIQYLGNRVEGVFVATAQEKSFTPNV